MGEKVKVNKTDRQIPSNWIYPLFKHQILHSMKHSLDLKRLLENVHSANGSKTAEGSSEQIHKLTLRTYHSPKCCHKFSITGSVIFSIKIYFNKHTSLQMSVAWKQLYFQKATYQSSNAIFLSKIISPLTSKNKMKQGEKENNLFF